MPMTQEPAILKAQELMETMVLSASMVYPTGAS